MLFYNKFSPIFTVVNLIEAHGEEQWNQGFNKSLAKE